MEQLDLFCFVVRFATFIVIKKVIVNWRAANFASSFELIISSESIVENSSKGIDD